MPSESLVFLTLNDDRPFIELKYRPHNTDYFLKIELDDYYPQRVQRVDAILPGGSQFSYHWQPWKDSISQIYDNFKSHIDSMKYFIELIETLMIDENLVILEPMQPSLFVSSWKILLDDKDLFIVLQLTESNYLGDKSAILHLEGKNSSKEFFSSKLGSFHW